MFVVMNEKGSKLGAWTETVFKFSPLKCNCYSKPKNYSAALLGLLQSFEFKRAGFYS